MTRLLTETADVRLLHVEVAVPCVASGLRRWFCPKNGRARASASALGWNAARTGDAPHSFDRHGREVMEAVARKLAREGCNDIRVDG